MLDRIQRELVLAAPPQEVWEVITGPGWLADEVTLDLVPGGDARFSSDDCVKDGWVEDVLAPDADSGFDGRLAFWWSADGEPATRVELTLEPETDGRTRLRVIEARPLDVFDVVGIPLPGSGGAAHGPALLAAA